MPPPKKKKKKKKKMYSLGKLLDSKTLGVVGLSAYPNHWTSVGMEIPGKLTLGILSQDLLLKTVILHSVDFGLPQPFTSLLATK